MREKMTGRVTIPTDMDVVPQTLEIMKRWGADAIRDCDGTDFPQQLRDTGAKVYATYYTTRKDNDWARAHPEEVQQCYIMTGFYAAQDGPLAIPLMSTRATISAAGGRSSTAARERRFRRRHGAMTRKAAVSSLTRRRRITNTR